MRLWRRLRGEAKSALQDIDLDKLASEGWPNLQIELEKAFPEGKLRQLPRLYRSLLQDTRLKVSMEQFAGELMRAKTRLEASDGDTKVSDGIMGYLMLTRSGLSEDEMKDVLGLTGGELKMTAIRGRMVELYPSGSSHRSRHTGFVAGEE